MVKMATLSALSDLDGSSCRTHPSPETVVGLKVLGADGCELGEVDDLFVDEGLNTCFLWAVSDLPELEETSLLIPFDIVARVTDRVVCLNRPAREVTNAPQYNPLLAEDDFLHQLIDYYATQHRCPTPGE